MSKEIVTFRVTLEVDPAAWRKEYGTEETDAEILAVIQERLHWIEPGPGTRLLGVERGES